MNRRNYLGTVFAAVVTISASTSVRSDSTDARCDIYPKGSDHASKMVACTFSQRQGWITLTAGDASYRLEPVGDNPGNYRDEAGRPVYRQSGLGDQGLIFRLESESIYVYWDTSALTPSTSDEDNPTAPFTTADYDATTLLRCREAADAEFSNCAAGISRMDDAQASIVVQSPTGEQFTINFMNDYVNATNREIEATLDGDTWTVTVTNGAVYEVPLAAIEGG